MQLTGTGFCLELSITCVERAVNWYWFVFGTEYNMRGACI